jgi:hypothetical protein
MGLKLNIKTLDEVHEDLQDAYVKDGDGYVLDFSAISDHPGVLKVKKTADDQDKKRKTAEAELKKVTDEYGNVDLDAYKEAMAKIEAMGEKEMIDAGNIDELLDKRVGAMRDDYDAKITSMTNTIAEKDETINSRTQELQDIKIYDAIKESALTKGVRTEALTDVSNRAKGVWSLEDGVPVAKKGDDILRGKSGDHLTIDEWVDGISVESPYLFEPNNGGGAGGSGKEGGGTDFSKSKVLSLDGAQSNLEQIASGDAVIQR